MGKYFEDPTLTPHDYYPPPAKLENLFPEKPEKKEPDYYCLARHKIKVGPNAGKYKYCYSRAGANTGHVGHGRCYLHGGVHEEQRYARLLHPTLNDLVQHYIEDPDPLNLLPELAVARAILHTFIDEEEAATQALIAWGASFEKERRGLHDLPLYDVRVLRVASGLLFEETQRAPHDVTDEEFHPFLERAVDIVRDEWAEAKEAAGGRAIKHFRVEKPQKVFDKVAAMRIIAEIRNLVKDIKKLEEEAYLSVFAVQETFGAYGEIVKNTVVALLKEKGVGSDEGEKLLEAIARRWEKTPVAQSSIPRSTATAGRR